MTLSKVDLSAMVRSSAASLREAQPDRNVTFSIASDISALGDPGLVRAVIDNLLSNAWKFTANTPDAVIKFYGETTDSEVVCHSRDNGAGFDMAYADKLFRPFQRLHDLSEYPGNGIGLATVRRIITRMGGKISAQGAPNQGGNFHLLLAAKC
jgi:light-regulated signal transduction histidine kinase (bacteriophytochrome)